MDHKDLRALLQQTSGLPEMTISCPEDQDIARYFDGRLDDSQRVTTQGHVAECAYCQARLGLLGRLESDPGVQPSGRLGGGQVPENLLEAAKQMSGRKKPRWKNRAPALAIAASVLLALTISQTRGPMQAENTAISPLPAQGTGAGDRTLRSIDQPDVQLSLLAPLEGAHVNPRELVIQWAAVPEALFYHLYVMNDAGDLVVNERVEATRWTAPQQQLFDPGTGYFVRIEANLGDTRTLSTGHVHFTVAGEN